LLQYAYSSNRGGMVEHFTIDVATVQPSAALINFIAPQKHAVASGSHIHSLQVSISILNGCEGIETVFLLLAAIVAFQTSWRNKLKGMFLGTCLIYCLNQARIVMLFFAAQENRQWFNMLHAYIAPSLIVVLSGLFFLWWTNTTKNNDSSHAA
jgi:exosortase family protein XrtM